MKIAVSRLKHTENIIASKLVEKGEVNFATKLLAAMRNKFGGHELNK